MQVKGSPMYRSGIYALITSLAVLCDIGPRATNGAEYELLFRTSAAPATFAPILTTVTFGNTPLTALIDTGSSDIAFDRKHEKLLGTPVEYVEADRETGSPDMRIFGRQRIRIGSHT